MEIFLRVSHIQILIQGGLIFFLFIVNYQKKMGRVIFSPVDYMKNKWRVELFSEINKRKFP